MATTDKKLFYTVTNAQAESFNTKMAGEKVIGLVGPEGSQEFGYILANGKQYGPTKSQIESMISIPSLSKGSASKPAASDATSISYIADVTVNGHTITPVYGALNIPYNVSINTDVTRPSDSHFITSLSVSSGIITPVYEKVENYEHLSAADMWEAFV